MGLLSWLVAAGRDTTSQIIMVWLVTAAIGLSHLHHSIVGSIEVVAALFASSQPTWGEFAHFLLWATLGNAFGGFFFVAVLKYSHVTRSPRSTPSVQLEEEQGRGAESSR